MNDEMKSKAERVALFRWGLIGDLVHLSSGITNVAVTCTTNTYSVGRTARFMRRQRTRSTERVRVNA